MNIDGQEFYNMIADLGENVIFLLDSEEIQQHASIRNSNQSFSSDGMFLFFGVMTFDNLRQQTEYIGEYFIRESKPDNKNLLLSVVNEPICDGKVGNIYCVECNSKIDIISHYTATKDEFGDDVLEPVYIVKDLDVYITTSTREQLEATVGTFIETTNKLILPAKYKISADNIIVKKGFVFNDKTKENEYTDIKYRVESVDNSMMFVDENNNFKGIIKCLMTEDKS